MDKKRQKIIVDSDISLDLNLIQNPKSQAPKDILDSLGIANVKYIDFSGDLRQGQIVMREDVIGDVKKFFELAYEIKFPIKSVIPISDSKYKWDDEASCANNNSSGFNYRSISGNPNKLSRHALGLAFDVNPVQNVYVRYDKNLKEIFRYPPNCFYNEKTLGTLTARHPLVILMKSLGWTWGGDWTAESGRQDYQHFEKYYND